LLIAVGLALLSIAMFFLAVGLRADPDPLREPRLMVAIRGALRDLPAQMREIPGVVDVLPATEFDLESMYFSSDSDWLVGSTLVVQVEEGIDIALVRDQLLELPGVRGYAERTDFGGTWRIGDELGGAWYDRKGPIVFLWPLLFAVPGMVLVRFAWRRVHISGGSAPVT